MSSPYSGTTVGRSATFTGCGGTAGKTAKFFVVLQPDEHITIQQTANSFDSQHSVFWSESTDPTAYVVL